MSDQATVSAHDLSGVRVIFVAGEFDISAAALIRDPLTAGIEAGGRVVIDLSGTTFVDSSILGVLVGAVRRAQASGGWVRLVSPQPPVRKVLSITGLDELLKIYDTVDAAVLDSGAWLG